MLLLGRGKFISQECKQIALVCQLKLIKGMLSFAEISIDSFLTRVVILSSRLHDSLTSNTLLYRWMPL